METIFYICPHCGNIITKLNDSGVNVHCCGQPMQKITPNTTDAATEKHLPIIKQSGTKITLKVGEIDHPMTDEHHISWIYLITNQNHYLKHLKPTSSPLATFDLLPNEKPLTAYSYCNLHGLWQTTL